MKRIINGKKYDTNTAKVMAVYYGGEPDNDYARYAETLHRKQTGEYFLHGKGGSASPYRESAGCNAWIGGERIIPMTEAKARTWAEKLDADDFETIFGEVRE